VATYEAIIASGAPAPWSLRGCDPGGFFFLGPTKVSGFSRYAAIDDRGDCVKEEIQNLLQQVGSLVCWSDRLPWMERVAR
jgi:hypothetical protein